MILFYIQTHSDEHVEKDESIFHLVAVTALLLAAVVGPDGIERVAPAGIYHGE